MSLIRPNRYLSTDTCVICQDDSEACIFLPCGHAVHGECMDCWLEHSENQDCPLCRFVCKFTCGHGLDGRFFGFLKAGTVLAAHMFGMPCGCGRVPVREDAGHDTRPDDEGSENGTNLDTNASGSAGIGSGPSSANDLDGDLDPGVGLVIIRRRRLPPNFQLDVTGFASALQYFLGFPPGHSIAWATETADFLRHRENNRDYGLTVTMFPTPGDYVYIGDYGVQPRDFALEEQRSSAVATQIAVDTQIASVAALILEDVNDPSCPHPSASDAYEMLALARKSLILGRNELSAHVWSICSVARDHYPLLQGAHMAVGGLMVTMALAPGEYGRFALEQEMAWRKLQMDGWPGPIPTVE